MLDSPPRGKRGPAPSWKLGRTRAIRVPIILADALLSLARQIDNGEVSLADAFPTKSDKQVPDVLVAQCEDEKDIQDEQTQKQHTLGIKRAEAEAIYAKAQLNFVKTQALFVYAQKNLFRNNRKPEK
ncbi:hypothetical protein SAMD00079811_40760 [Scytonema sp. HK-05]|uniref:hypothetical protein n=1 Tax=Scytonema sp. HK-05 TaxID=1137095 RepID=UPI0009361D5D|nr:hypothetical protein [Scytonema sp. HK-05]OKH61065.1 hypothetical protein NIES2130_00900 [Scytonema sp. HK-05]BAY46464.1 hypothetical protein SAMD00079811_40760 [Scytonema sp. HK-05]